MELGQSLPVQDCCELFICCAVEKVPRSETERACSQSIPASAQGTFPGNLQLVLVLRPSRFFQKAIADIGIKLHKEDFKMKVPVSLLQRGRQDSRMRRARADGWGRFCRS